jgi:hypothetical protein
MTTIRFALLPLLALAASASLSGAEPKPPTPPPPPPPDSHPVAGCETSGPVALEIDHDAVAGSKLPTSQTKIFDTGAWTFAETLGDGKPGRSLSGCFAKADVAKLKAVEDAPWKITHPQIHCMAMSQTSTAYRLHGKPDYVARTCGNDIMDDKTLAALGDLEKLADTSVEGASHPPCCKK